MTKIIAVLVALAFAPAAFAQNAYRLFEAVGTRDSGAVTSAEEAIPFGENTLLLKCPESPSAVLSGSEDPATPFYVDNFVDVNGKNICKGAPLRDGILPCFDYNGSYVPVAAIPISGELLAGKNIVTFELMDFGGLLGSSELWLVTNCVIDEKVEICHKPGTPAEKPLLVPQSALKGHLGHGDQEGACQ